VRTNSLRTAYNHKAGVLDCCFSDKNQAFSGGMDRTLKMYEFASENELVLGSHEKAIRCLSFCPELGLVISGSWDATVKLWDTRSQAACTGTFTMPDKVYTMALSANRLIVGCCGRHVLLYDLRRMDTPLQKRLSNLKFQTRCIRAFPDNTGYALSSTEGRVAIEYFDTAAEVQAKRYAFKCHRTSHAGTQIVWPVNAMAFHPIWGTFATGGCDGFVNIWDGQNKKRLCQFHKYPASIASLAFNADGSYLAIASSYTFEEGEKDHAPDSIFIRTPSEAEVKPKSRPA